MYPNQNSNGKLIYIISAAVITPLLLYFSFPIASAVVGFTGFFLITAGPLLQTSGMILAGAVISVSVLPALFLLSKVLSFFKILLKIHLALLTVVLVWTVFLYGYIHFAYSQEQGALQEEAREQGLFYRATYLPPGVEEINVRFYPNNEGSLTYYGYGKDNITISLFVFPKGKSNQCILTNSSTGCYGGQDDDYETLMLDNGHQAFYKRGSNVRFGQQTYYIEGSPHLVWQTEDADFEMVLAVVRELADFRAKYFDPREEFVKIANSLQKTN